MKINYALDAELSATQYRSLAQTITATFAVNAFELSQGQLTLDIADTLCPHKLSTLIKQFVLAAKKVEETVIYQHRPTLHEAADPMPYLTSSGLVQRVAPGLYAFQGIFLTILNTLNARLRHIAIHDYAAIEQEYPILWPVSLFREMNYFENFPGQAILTTAVKDRFAEKTAFAAKYAKDKAYDAIRLDEHCTPSQYGLQPSVCNTCYYLLRGQRHHHNRIYTTYNKVFRNETIETDSLARLTSFSVRDIMFVGDANFVHATQKKLIESLTCFVEALCLSCRICSAHDYFFSDAAQRKLFQQYFDLKYEIRADIPHSHESVAIGSVNMHQDHFGQCFGIQLIDKQPVFSGCIGVGFERLAYALYCQHGHQLSRWPEQLRKTLALDD